MLIRANILTPDGLLPEAVLEVDGESIGDIRSDASGDALSLPSCVLVPGFVDMHCHGGGGYDMTTDPAQAAHFHLTHGTTTMLGSLVTASRDDLLEQVGRLGSLVADDTLAGIHLEGPWLSAHQCGAHDESLLRAPDLAEITALLKAGAGSIRMATIAPELPGAIDAIEFLASAGVIAAIGHTDCDYDTCLDAIDAGATVATHLFNRMPHLGKRHPGPVLALLESADVTLELIPDGIHVDPNLMRYVAGTAGVQRVAAVTDAMAAAGAGDGHYLLGELDVDVVDGVARLTGEGNLAGSTLTMDRALQVLVTECGLELADASQMLSATPARTLGLADRGVLAPGRRADLVALDDSYEVVGVMRAGQWVVQP